MNYDVYILRDVDPDGKGIWGRPIATHQSKDGAERLTSDLKDAGEVPVLVEEDSLPGDHEELASS